MEHDPNSPPDPWADEQPEGPREKKPLGWLKIVLFVVIAAVVVFIAAVGLFFGACLLA